VRLYTENGRFAFLASPLAGLGATYDDPLRLIGKRVMDLVHAFVTIDYCNGVLHRVSVASDQPLVNLLVPRLELYCVSGSSATSPRTFEIDYIGCPLSRELNTKCVSWCTSVGIRLHQQIPGYPTGIETGTRVPVSDCWFNNCG